MTAWLIEAERPKSSAFTTRRRGGELDAIVVGPTARGESQPGAQNEQGLLSLVKAGYLGTKNVEALPLQLAQQPPIDRPHQLGGHHRTAVRGGQGLAGQPIAMPGALSHAVRQFKDVGRVFQPQNLLPQNLEP